MPLQISLKPVVVDSQPAYIGWPKGTRLWEAVIKAQGWAPTRHAFTEGSHVLPNLEVLIAAWGWPMR